MIRAFKIILGVSFAALLIGCISSDISASKNDTVKKGNSLQSDNERSDAIEVVSTSIEDFDKFFTRFNKDSVFQISRIIFPLKLNSVGEEGEGETLIDKQGWRFTSLSEEKDIKRQIKRIILDKEHVKIEYSIEDTGVLVDHLFCVHNGVWWLCSITDQSD